MVMNSVICLNMETNEQFVRYFDDVEKQRKFMIKCRFSKKIKVIGWDCQDYDEYRYLSYVG